MELNQKIRCTLRYLAFIAILVAPTVKGGIIYDESVSGDLPAFGEPVFTLVEGTNSVIGSACAGAEAAGCPDSDSISFLLEPGLILDSVMFRAFNQSLDPRNDQLGIGYWLIDSETSPPNFFLESVFFRVAELDLQAGFETVLPLGAGLYRLAPSLFGPFFADTINEWDYELQLQVSSVPAPSTVLLTLLACLGVAGSRVRLRRRKLLAAAYAGEFSSRS